MAPPIGTSPNTPFLATRTTYYMPQDECYPWFDVAQEIAPGFRDEFYKGINVNGVSGCTVTLPSLNDLRTLPKLAMSLDRAARQFSGGVCSSKTVSIWPNSSEQLEAEFFEVAAAAPYIIQNWSAHGTYDRDEWIDDTFSVQVKAVAEGINLVLGTFPNLQTDGAAYISDEDMWERALWSINVTPEGFVKDRSYKTATFPDGKISEYNENQNYLFAPTIGGLTRMFSAEERLSRLANIFGQVVAYAKEHEWKDHRVSLLDHVTNNLEALVEGRPQRSFLQQTD